MKLNRETSAGWAASILLHGALLLLFFLISIPDVIQNQDFIEVIWGSPSVTTPSPLAKAESVAPAANASPSVAIKEKRAETKKSSRPVFLPERRLTDPTDEVLANPRSEKLEVTEPGKTRTKVETGGVGDRDATTGQSMGDRDRTGPPSSMSGSSVGPASGLAGPGGDVDKGVSFSIQWMQGGTRRKLSGELPKYPAGVNVEAQIKILTVVLPDGSVKSAQPAQKANPVLEDVAMKEVRFWKFEPLRSSQPQQDQTCVVTFLFTLR